MRHAILFRTAPPRSRGTHLAWTAAQCAVVWGATLVAGPALLVALERAAGITGFGFGGRQVVGAALFSAFTALNLLTALVLVLEGRGTPLPLASPSALVVAGPYRHVRNPMAIAGIGQGVAVAVWLGSWTVLAYAAAGALFWHFLIRPVEERDLAMRFGASYEAYRRAVPLWWPRRRGYRAAP